MNAGLVFRMDFRLYQLLSGRFRRMPPILRILAFISDRSEPDRSPGSLDFQPLVKKEGVRVRSARVPVPVPNSRSPSPLRGRKRKPGWNIACSLLRRARSGEVVTSLGSCCYRSVTTEVLESRRVVVGRLQSVCSSDPIERSVAAN